MKVKNVAVAAAVCAALVGSQASLAEEQPIAAEGMDFAFDDAEVSSVEMSELSGVEMEETEGAWAPLPILNAGIGGLTSTGTYLITSPNPTAGGFGASAISGAGAGFASGNPVSAAQNGAIAGGVNAGADAANSGAGGGSFNPY